MSAEQTGLHSLREDEFARLDATGMTYLDYTGAALYPSSLIWADARRLTSSVFGNPHSGSTPSRASSDAIGEATAFTLALLDADRTQYDVVFTANASAAIELVASAFPFRPGSRLLLSADNHNAVNGMRVPAEQSGATTDYIPLDHQLHGSDPDPWLFGTAGSPSLFTYPAQSNFSGVKHPLEWIDKAHAHGFHVLLDAAAFLSSNTLSLKNHPADFVALSFYKLFGFPTGVGALVAKREALELLARKSFSGGSVDFVSVQNRMFEHKQGSARFESGTPNFLAMPAVADGLRWFQSLGAKNIRDHVGYFTTKLHAALTGLGQAVAIYGPVSSLHRGNTVAFNMIRDGVILPFEDVEERARTADIAIRGGCFCNPGAAEHALAMPASLVRECLRRPFSIPGFRSCLGGTGVGALRASVGIATNMTDIERLISFLGTLGNASAQKVHSETLTLRA